MYRVKNRDTERAHAKQSSATKAGQTEKIGFIPRNKVPVLQATGYSATKDEDEPDADTAAGLARLKEKDADIDRTLGDVLRIVDNLDNIAGAMNEEVKAQQWKTRAIEGSLGIAEQKQAIVNARQKKLLKTT